MARQIDMRKHQRWGWTAERRASQGSSMHTATRRGSAFASTSWLGTTCHLPPAVLGPTAQPLPAAAHHFSVRQ